MFEALLIDTNGIAISALDVIFTLLVALISGLMIRFTYFKTQRPGEESDNFGITLVILPAVIAIIILLIGSNIARAFSLAGAFSIIRFRSAPGEPKDIAFVLFTMAAGLAVGVSAYAYALFFTLILCTILYVYERLHKKRPQKIQQTLLITVPENMNFENEFLDVFKEFTDSHTLMRIKTTAMGSLFQLTYSIILKENSSIKGFIDELRVRNSNLNIALLPQVDYNEK